MASRRKIEATTTAGTVRGKLGKDGRIAHFRGVPYAAPPVGDLRWKPPAPVEPWSGTRKCTKFGAYAYQQGTFIELFFERLLHGLGMGKLKTKAMTAALSKMPIKESEDCLTLNVHAPAHAERLPVMVWVHGGDQTDGSGNDPLYNVDALPRRGCVLVTINYRLGLFGWFAHPELDAESADGVSGNYGLLDQIAALEWVRDNIAAFGGDPGDVTIFGESAGGQGVLNLMTAPAARGLFHRAVAQSPSDSGRWLHHRRPVLDWEPKVDVGARFASLAVGDEPGQLERLRAMDADEIMERYRDHRELGRYFYPAVDGVVLPTTPMTAFSLGRQAPVPLMIGYNADEASLFVDVMHPAGPEVSDGWQPGDDPVEPPAARAAFERSYPTPGHVDRLMAAYPGLAELDRSAVADQLGDHMFGVHVDHASRQHAAAGHPTYRYHFRALPASPDQTAGAFHAAEIPYVFDASLPLVPDADDAHLLVGEMGDRWFAFAATGVPDSPGREPWPAYTAEQPQHMVFDRPRSVVQPCPAQAGLDVMRERIAWLDEQVAADPAGAPAVEPAGAPAS